MIRYLKLTNFELNRFFTIYLVLIGVTLVMQVIGVLTTSFRYMGDIEDMLERGTSQADAISQLGLFSFSNITNTFWFSAPIALCIVTLLIYVLFIWYRDWLGKNTFAYRLLMIPTARINVFFAKATAIFLMVLGLISFQIVFLLIENELVKQIIPATLRLDQSLNQMISGFDYLRILYPTTFIQFLINYGAGLMVVIVVFTSVLLERCFRWKGIILGILYAGLSLVIFFSPVLLEGIFLPEFFYPIEIFVLLVITGLLVTAGSIWMSHYLLNKKIRV